ncbi:MAG: AMP-binding protein [Prevotella sp.]
MRLDEFLSQWHNESPLIEVQTSGSTGAPKRMMVEKRRMEASARITCSFLGLKDGDTALLCMPLDYIAGKMVVVRAVTSKLRLIAVEPSSHPLGNLETAPTFAAMVPLQVFNSLQVPNEAETLRNIKHLIIGGGAIDAALEAQLRSFPNAVWSTYGMTETLSHIALRRINGEEASPWYSPLEGVNVSLNADSCLVIDAPAVCQDRLITNDIAELHPDGRRFRILGRKDNVICSGGLKIQIEEVERLLKPLLPNPFIVTKRPDPRLGEAVALLFAGDPSSEEDIKEICRKTLPHHWVPRYIYSTDHIPMTGTGKPARAEAEKMVLKLI